MSEYTVTATLDDIRRLLEIHGEIYREISKGLDYESDDEGYSELLSNKVFDRLDFSKISRDNVAKYLEISFFTLGKQIAHHSHKRTGRDQQPPLTHQPRLLEKWNTALAIRAALIHASLKSVGGSTELEYYPALPNVENFEKLSPVILRQEDKSFWEACLSGSMERKICGVGFPGIGKTTTTFYLLKQIVMERKKTVVYAVQEQFPRKTVYTKFVPVVVSGAVVDVTVSCIESDQGRDGVHELCNGDYYIVDPGDTKSSCDVRFSKNVCFILVCSCDESHWGKNEFTKMRSRGGNLPVLGLGEDFQEEFLHSIALDNDEDLHERTLGGAFVYCNSWTLRDLVNGKQILGLGHLSDENICSRYRVIGGSVRRIIDFSLATQEQRMANALSRLSGQAIHELADGRCDFAFNTNAPESTLVSVEPHRNNPLMYDLAICSDFAEEMIAQKHLKLSWYAVLDEDNSGNRGNLFESFVRVKLSRQMELAMDRDSSPDPPPKESKDRKKNYKESSTTLHFSNRTIVRVTNLAQSVRNGSAANLYYSRDEAEPLIGMIFRFDGGFMAIQVTIRTQHVAATAKIRDLVAALSLADNEKLVIVYAVPCNRLQNFETTPVNPLLGHPDLAKKVEIHHVGIQDEQ